MGFSGDIVTDPYCNIETLVDFLTVSIEQVVEVAAIVAATIEIIKFGLDCCRAEVKLLI